MASIGWKAGSETSDHGREIKVLLCKVAKASVRQRKATEWAGAREKVLDQIRIGSAWRRVVRNMT
jgi:hypothetical protein